MALSAVSSALQTIGNVVAQEAIYLWGVEEQVACLQTELKWMQSFLRKADAIQSRDETIRLWVAEIRELAYDAEDVIGDFALRIRPRKRNCIKRSACILKDGWMLHNTRSKIEKILTGVTDLVRRLQAYGIKELREEDSTSAERRESRRPYPHIIDEHIVGLDTAIKELVSVIVDSRGYLYQLQCLNLEQSWELFRKIAFSQASAGIVFSEEEDGIEGSITEDLAKRYLMELVERSKLPSSLGNLRRLQTLDLRARGGFWLDSLHVPDVIWRMEQLRHLYLPDECHRKTKLKLGTLRNLQTLVNFNTDNCFLRDLINMTNIRELVIRGAFEIEDFNAEDSDKNPAIIQGRHLHSLSIINTYGSIDPRHLKHLLSSCVSVCKLSLAVEISELPEYHHLSSDLTYIHLEASHLEEDPMPTLEKLPNLRVLELNTSAFKGKEMSCSAKGFPKLESLSLDWLYNLEEWKVDDGAMPCLRRLEIEKCRELKMIPDGLRYITTLQELKIERMPKAFRVRVEEGGEDFGKVQHVPSRIFKHCDE
ncbi:hypothetical protein V6N12_057458 [Hibiscus sabdariffa]|uniref:Rx N-terminal domain-containing protein n=1 Tax=Hibiscus sabdariffa TaxID=183260 RepID=A0ABR2C5T8_9ROSI